MKRVLKISGVLLLVIVGMYSCKEEDPFKDLENTAAPEPTKPPVVSNYASDSFIGLHNNIFSKTCANSGCHDGAFPPDFRTIESSYNTLIYQPIVKNNPNNDYEYRVVPGDANNSILYRRLIEDIDGQSGIMPLVADNKETDWNAKKTQYINDVKNWINKGAPDIFGNLPDGADAKPGFLGAVAYNADTDQKLERVTVQGNMVIPFGMNNVYFYFAFSDDKTDPNDFTENEVRIFNQTTDFENSTFDKYNMETGYSLRDVGFNGDSATFSHRVNIDLAQYPNLTKFYLQCLVKDAREDVTSIPSSTSTNYVFDYFSFAKDN